MKKVIAVFLILTALSAQGCFIIIGNKGGCSGKQTPPETHCKTAVQATLDTISSMKFESDKVSALEVLIETPMSESDYIAMMRVIKNLTFASDQQKLTLKAINARAKFKAAENQQIPDCNSQR